MPWVKLDDQFFGNPKVIELSKDAKLLYMAALTHCSAQLTDGQITPSALRVIGAMVDVDRERAEELVGAGLWERDGADFVVHDYLEYNPSAERVRGEREAAKDRMKRVRSPELPPNVRPNFAGSSPVGSPEVRLPRPHPSPGSSTTNPEGQKKVDGGATAPPKRAARASRLPRVFPVTEDMAEWAREHVPGLDLDYAHEEFCTYWRGEGATKLDWGQTWRNGMLKAFNRLTQANRRAPPAATNGRHPTNEYPGGDYFKRLAAQRDAAKAGER